MISYLNFEDECGRSISSLKTVGFLKDLLYSSFAFKESVFYDLDL